MVSAVAMLWPLQVGSHELMPVERGLIVARDTVHLAASQNDIEEMLERVPNPDRASSHRPDTAATDRDELQGSVWATRTLCGRTWGVLVLDPTLDLFGEDRDLLCQSCWRIVEGWLSSPPPSDGEDEVVAWIVSSVLATGEALVEGVPVPRFEAVRGRVRSEIKRAIGGSVRTAKIGPTSLWVMSRLVVDAKTPERWEAELRAAAERVEGLQAGDAVQPPTWRRHWSEIAGLD